MNGGSVERRWIVFKDCEATQTGGVERDTARGQRRGFDGNFSKPSRAKYASMPSKHSRLLEAFAGVDEDVMTTGFKPISSLNKLLIKPVF